jgi:hypothetical protein
MVYHNHQFVAPGKQNENERRYYNSWRKRGEFVDKLFLRHIFHQHSKLNLNLTAELLANKWQAEWTYSHNRTATDAGVVYLRKILLFWQN